MPEIPNVVSGEPVESNWGNDIRDRAVMKYADLTALDFSQPLPQLGELAWLDNPGHLVCCTAIGPSVWTPVPNQTQADARFVNIAGDTMTGLLTAPNVHATTALTAVQRVDAPLTSYYADSSGVLPILATPQIVGRFTVPVTGRWLLISTLQGTYSGLDRTNGVRTRLLRNAAQVSVSIENIYEQWATGGGGISTGTYGNAMQYVSAFVGAGDTFEWDVGYVTTSAPVAGGAFATDFDWFAMRLDGIAQPQAAAWTP